ncbi:MAG: hypothetical protein AAGA66_21900, partial [Bacteroidota bacterium]
KIYSRANDGITVRNREYNAYLKFEDGNKLHLLTKKDKSKLIKKVTEVAEFLQSPITDYTKTQ